MRGLYLDQKTLFIFHRECTTAAVQCWCGRDAKRAFRIVLYLYTRAPFWWWLYLLIHFFFRITVVKKKIKNILNLFQKVKNRVLTLYIERERESPFYEIILPAVSDRRIFITRGTSCRSVPSLYTGVCCTHIQSRTLATIYTRSLTLRCCWSISRQMLPVFYTRQ